MVFLWPFERFGREHPQWIASVLNLAIFEAQTPELKQQQIANNWSLPADFSWSFSNLKSLLKQFYSKCSNASNQNILLLPSQGGGESVHLFSMKVYPYL